MRYTPIMIALLAVALLCGCNDDTPLGGSKEADNSEATTELSSVSSEQLWEIVNEGDGNIIIVGGDYVSISVNEAKGELIDRGEIEAEEEDTSYDDSRPFHEQFEGVPGLDDEIKI